MKNISVIFEPRLVSKIEQNEMLLGFFKIFMAIGVILAIPGLISFLILPVILQLPSHFELSSLYVFLCGMCMIVVSLFFKESHDKRKLKIDEKKKEKQYILKVRILRILKDHFLNQGISDWESVHSIINTAFEKNDIFSYSNGEMILTQSISLPLPVLLLGYPEFLSIKKIAFSPLGNGIYSIGVILESNKSETKYLWL